MSELRAMLAENLMLRREQEEGGSRSARGAKGTVEEEGRGKASHRRREEEEAEEGYGARQESPRVMQEAAGRGRAKAAERGGRDSMPMGALEPATSAAPSGSPESESLTFQRLIEAYRWMRGVTTSSSQRSAC